jgi:hypothetical protein
MKYPCFGCTLDLDCNDEGGKARDKCALLKKYLDSIVSKATTEDKENRHEDAR